MWYATLLVLALLLSPMSVLAANLVPDGDSGLAGFTVQGNVSIVSSDTLVPEGTTVTPLHGNTMIKMVSNGADTSMFTSMNVGTNGAILSVPFTLSFGASYSFSWLFDARETSLGHEPVPGFNDFAQFFVYGEGQDATGDYLIRWEQPLSSIAYTGQTGNSGWQTFTIFGSGTGTDTGILGWVVSNQGDTVADAVLYLDAQTTVVPEPTSVLLLASGMAGVGLWRRLQPGRH